MASVNARISDVLISRGVDLMRFAEGSRRQVLDLLENLRDDLASKLQDVDVTAPLGSTTERVQRQLQLFQQTEQSIKSAYGDVEELHKGQMRDLADLEARHIVGKSNSVLGVKLLSMGLTPTTLETLADDTLITGSPAKDWWGKQSNDLNESFKREVRIGVASGETNDQIVRRVRGTHTGKWITTINKAGVAKRRAEFTGGIMQASTREATTLVRTSVQAVAQETRSRVFADNSDVVKGWTFLTTLDGRTCPICMAHSGTSWNHDGDPLGPKDDLPKDVSPEERQAKLDELRKGIAEKHQAQRATETAAAPVVEPGDANIPPPFVPPDFRMGSAAEMAADLHGIELDAAPEERDPRLPPAGTVITKTYKGTDHNVEVGEKTFTYQGKEYKSLSRIASDLTGSSTNGFKWFGLNEPWGGAKAPAPAPVITPPTPIVVPKLIPNPNDPRLPPIGQTIKKAYKGKEIEVLVGDKEFTYEGEKYGSLSSLASKITGNSTNGFAWFGLKEPFKIPGADDAPAPAPAPTPTQPTKTLPGLKGIQFTEVGNADFMGGAHKGKLLLADPDGKQYLFKPNKMALVVEAEASASKIARLIDPQSVIVESIKYNGKLGTVQPLVENVKHTSIDVSNLTPEQAKYIAKRQVVDWLVGNHDAHNGQFLVKDDGHIVETDLGQAWKFHGKDKLSIHYQPNTDAVGEKPPVYNQLVKSGKVKFEDIVPAIKHAQTITDDQIREALIPYAQARWPGDTKEQDNFIEDVQLRRNLLYHDFKKLYASAASQPSPTPTTTTTTGSGTLTFDKRPVGGWTDEHYKAAAKIASSKGRVGKPEGKEPDEPLSPAMRVRGVTPEPINEWSRDLSNIERKVVVDYTASGFKAMNDAVRIVENGGNLAPIYETAKAKADILQAALKRAPKFEGLSFRGTRLPADVEDLISEGSTFKFKGFASTSIRKQVATSFIGGGPAKQTVIFEIKGKTGVVVQPLSTHSHEDEVLMPTDAKFRVGKITRPTNIDRYFVVQLIEE